MPRLFNILLFLLISFNLITVESAPCLDYPVSQGIFCYYLRYDVQSHKNRIKDEKLTMVPAGNDFRVENFSHLTMPCTISSHPGETKADLDERLKEYIMKSVLEQNGLRSVKTYNAYTVVSYEGAFLTPVLLEFIPETSGQEKAAYQAHIRFAPLAFPDQWEKMKTRHQLNSIYQDFFQLFK